MNVIDYWTAAMMALPKELRLSFGKPNIMPIGANEQGTINFQFNNQPIDYKLMVFPNVGHGALGFIKQAASAYRTLVGKDSFILTGNIYPKIANELVEAGINFMDTSGNVYINQPDVYIMRLGAKSNAPATKELKSRLFSESGIKVLFGMLQNEEFLNISYREMADAVNISPSSISIIINELIKSNYLHESRGKKILNKKNELLQRWAIAFNERLKPKLKIGDYASKTTPLIKDFKKFDLAPLDALWGGEAAGNLYTNYLSPAKLTLFVPEKSKNWMRDLKLIPTEDKVEIEVLRIFWNKNHPIFKEVKSMQFTVPPLLAYAELIGTNDSRNIETAQRIFDEYIQFTD